MVDVEKTNLLRQKIAEKKNEDNESPNKLGLLVLSVAKFLAFYGSLWIVLTKFHNTPFNILESLLIYLGIASISFLWKRK